jgi:ADP-heptose:LPS heptosyltransferase
MKLWFERGAWSSRRGRKIADEIEPSGVQRVAVIRHAALGDMVLVRPFLVELRKFFPNAEIVLSVVSNYQYGVPDDLVDRVHVIHGSDQKSVAVRERLKAAKELGTVDLLFDLADTTRSRYLCALTKAKLKIGFPYRGYLRWLLYDATVPRSDFSFEAINMLDMLMLFGANPAIPPDFGWEKSHQVQEKTKRVIYFPFASVSSKCWNRENFLSLIEQMVRKYPKFQHVVLGGTGKEEALDPFEGIAQLHESIRLESAMDLGQLTVHLADSSLVISNDTGVRNLAIAVNTPTVGVFFSTVPYRYWPRYGQHEAVFEASGDQPDVKNVLRAAIKILGTESDDP